MPEIIKSFLTGLVFFSVLGGLFGLIGLLVAYAPAVVIGLAVIGICTGFGSALRSILD